MSEPIIEVRHLSKSFGTHVVLRDVDFTVKPGDVTCVIGASGSGKSTLLHLLGGVDKPTSGKVYVDGCDVYAQNEEKLAIFRRRQVGLIYQFYNLIPVLDVVENMTLPVLLDGQKVNSKRLNELLDTLGLRGRERHLPNQLSGGQQQRVSIARALAGDPAVILADEPTGALDSHTSREVLGMLQKLHREGNTVVLITHDNSIAVQAERIIRLEDGHIVYDGDAHAPEAVVQPGVRAAGGEGCA